MCPEMVKRESEPKNTETVKNKCSLASLCSDPEVFMQILNVKLRKGNNETVVRVIIDTGSQKSYITEDAAALVGYEPAAERQMTHSFGGQKSGTLNHKEYVVHLRSLDDGYACNLSALGQTVICGEISSIKSVIWLEELQKLNIKIMDVNNGVLSVSILIEAGIAGKLLTGRRQILECGLVAVETLLGWTLMGAVPVIEKREDMVQVLKTIETKTQKEHEEKVRKDFLKTVKLNKEGRYEVRLPWLENHTVLNNNKDMAIRRLQSTVKKLQTKGLYAEYNSIFESSLAEGIVERVPEKEANNWAHYLPYRHDIKENSTTRIRPVFDASVKERQFPSLNECLGKGANLIKLVTSVL
ncbi:PREDICTED: uncharacterized protein LOC108571046 [Habropoda laboriosa]|uniref:uncharacterized protein LOC108571046 n=1 Tax=Habropoda laboriosa TaxID=597456 RepID=UPI00083DA2BB|nr:PREDICTED: uncharacterized protein LOC108571046 [Habropoda laboriosa]